MVLSAQPPAAARILIVEDEGIIASHIATCLGRSGYEEAATVLLVEDHESIRSLLHNYLANSGYTVLDAEDAEEAIRTGNQHSGPIDLLITDVVMPKGNGFEVARAVSAGRPQMKTIIMSGYSSSGRESVPVGALLLRKPFVRADLLKAVGELLEPKDELALERSA